MIGFNLTTLVIVLGVFIFTGFRIVMEYERGVIFRLGRIRTMKTAGINWIIPIIDRMVESLKPNGCIITNFLLNQDYQNVEHVNMDKKAVTSYLVSKGIFPLNEVMWIKRDLGFMDAKPAAMSAA